MDPGYQTERKWSDKNMEDDNGLRTVECLRGRLLAERQASRAAKEDAELMGNKLIELETQLRKEIESRKKAEKKLKFLIKKFESLKISVTLEESEQSSSSDNSTFSCRSSTITSGSQEPEDQELKSEIANPEIRESPSIEQHSGSQLIADSVKDPSATKPTSDTFSSSTSKDSTREMDPNGGNDNDDRDSVDNSLALVPVTLPGTSRRRSEAWIADESVIEVLDALRHAREKIQTSMERRQMIRVGLS